jgi:hypothetical protein
VPLVTRPLQVIPPKNKVCYSNEVAATGMDLAQNVQDARYLAQTFWYGTPGQSVDAAKTYLNLVGTNGAWDPKDWPTTTQPQYETFTTAGNINFGATCAQFGLGWVGKQICQLGAGIAAHRNGSTGTSSYFSQYHGDQPIDNVNVRKGIAIGNQCP